MLTLHRGVDFDWLGQSWLKWNSALAIAHAGDIRSSSLKKHLLALALAGDHCAGGQLVFLLTGAGIDHLSRVQYMESWYILALQWQLVDCSAQFF